MARIYHAGAEIDPGVSAQNVGAEGSRSSGNVTRDTTTFRSGLASWKFDATGSNLASSVSTTTALFTFAAANSPYYARAYFKAAAAPTAITNIFRLGGTTELIVKLLTDGTIELTVNAVVQGSPSAATITDGAWHRIELSGTIVSTNWTAAELRLDGATVSTFSGTQAMTTNMLWGWISNPGANKILNVDDVALNSSSGAANNSWCGAGSVVLLLPTSDNAKGAGWTNDANTTTNFYDTVNNTPPIGITDTSAGTGLNQIRNATSNANSNYDANMTTYTAAGVGASDTVNAIIPWVLTAAPLVTSAKSGTVGVVSNPAITNVNLAVDGTSGAFWSGLAGGTYGSGWKWSAGTMTDSPSVTLGTAPVMRITQVTSSTRIAVVCGMFIYVDYTPAAAAAVIPDVNMALAVT